jgi:hypothetical protein
MSGKAANNLFRFAIVLDCDGDIDIARESGLCARRDREASYERKPRAAGGERCDDRAQLARQRRFGRRNRPGASPCSAPGRARRHRLTSASSASAEIRGCSRRSFCRSMASASSKSSAAIWMPLVRRTVLIVADVRSGEKPAVS